MDDAAAVRVRQPQHDLLRDPHRLRRSSRRRSGALFSTAFKVAAAHVLRDDVRLAAVVSDVVNRDDVRVVAELRHRLGLALHARQAGVVEALGLDHRDRDVAVELRVVREVDLLAAAFAEEASDGVAAVGEGGWQCRGGRGCGCFSTRGAGFVSCLAAGIAETGRWPQLRLAFGAGARKRCAAPFTECSAFAVLMATGRTEQPASMRLFGQVSLIVVDRRGGVKTTDVQSLGWPESTARLSSWDRDAWSGERYARQA